MSIKPLNVLLAGNRGVFLRLILVDMCKGNLYDALLLSQIVYWYMPDESGQTKLRRQHNGKPGIYKNHGDWYQECRIKAATARKSLDRLKKLGVIHYELHGEEGRVTPFICLNEERFNELYTAHIEALQPTPPVTREQPPLLHGNSPLLPENDSNTESTSESVVTSVTSNGSTEPNPQPKALTPYQEYKALIKRVFDVNDSRVMDIYNVLQGRSKRHEAHNIQPPATFDEVKGFAMAWALKHANSEEKILMPRSPETLHKRFTEWRQSMNGFYEAIRSEAALNGGDPDTACKLADEKALASFEELMA